MCTQCVAQGAAYAVPGLALLRLWSRGRVRRLEGAARTVVDEPTEPARTAPSR